MDKLAEEEVHAKSLLFIEKIVIPIEEFPPGANVVGSLLGKHGAVHRSMEAETRTYCSLRGRGKGVRDPGPGVCPTTQVVRGPGPQAARIIENWLNCLVLRFESTLILVFTDWIEIDYCGIWASYNNYKGLPITYCL